MCCAIYFAYPGDTIRRRMISSCGDYQNVVECIKRIIKNEGIRGFFGGSNIIMIQSIPAGSLLFVYDWLFGKMGNDCK